jgi:Domain of unknown function (DUF4389)
MSTIASAYPVRVDGELAPDLSRWLWLVKWLLAIPHILILVFLWIGFVLATIGAFFVLLVGRPYPRGLYEYNLGVLRWSWRVAFYTYSALGTDRYPPFSLGPEPDYPARLDIPYPDTQRHGLPLVGWWLAGIPQYIVAAAFAGGLGFAWSFGLHMSFGLIGLLVFVSALVLLFKGFYPRNIYEFVMGMNRWALRVCAYGTFLTPVYPPFRIDAGEHEGVI